MGVGTLIPVLKPSSQVCLTSMVSEAIVRPIGSHSAMSRRTYYLTKESFPTLIVSMWQQSQQLWGGGLIRLCEITRTFHEPFTFNNNIKNKHFCKNREMFKKSLQKIRYINYACSYRKMFGALSRKKYKSKLQHAVIFSNDSNRWKWEYRATETPGLLCITDGNAKWVVTWENSLASYLEN